MTQPLFAFDTSYARLPERFYSPAPPAPAPDPAFLALNRPLAEQMGIDPERLASEEGRDALTGRAAPEGAALIAMAYAGAQFGHFVPQLGDGRAVLLGEVVGPDGARRDIQVKGAGRTPYSRMGDGKAPLGPALREYLVSEAMHALGVPTTRALAVLRTGEVVLRDAPLPGAVIVRVATAHIRVGTFQYFASRGDREGLEILLNHAAERAWPETLEADNPAAAFLRAVSLAQAKLVAKWLSLGFIHGVMNTDNMSVTGETIDYGPCAFMDAYAAGRVYSSIDRHGRYAYGNQPKIAHWNLLQLAEALLPLMGETEEEAVAAAQEALDVFPGAFSDAWRGALQAKLGLTETREGDDALAEDFLAALEAGEADFTLAFRGLGALRAEGGPETDGPVRELFRKPGAFDAWAVRWRARLAEEARSDGERRAAMDQVNPAIIPRNHLVEEALRAAQDGDMAPFDALHAALAAPFADRPAGDRYAQPPAKEEEVRATFCGT
ncbi:protein adenylyltransferase SelO [Rhodovulum sp. DZ06]|uniref:protein adenylyltransferase SelO n=1 Tax=Rhodovulum sp. DZ06 TaxID=3425126 RepID=UPI003D328B53